VMMYIRFPLSPRNAEDLLHEPGIDSSKSEMSQLGQERWSALRLKLVCSRRQSRRKRRGIDDRWAPHAHQGRDRRTNILDSRPPNAYVLVMFPSGQRERYVCIRGQMTGIRWECWLWRVAGDI
jgi:hypothetical protein